MGKRTNFERRERDAYATPGAAVVPLLPHLEPKARFIEPCAGAGDLVGHLERAGNVCIGAFDLPTDARITRYAVDQDTIFITNIPWRPQFEPNKIIANLSDQRPAWILFYCDWLFTSRATPLLPRLRSIVVIGRVKWIPDSKYSGFENACWLLFDRPRPGANTMVRFIGRGDSTRIDLARRVA